jgi:hypothetical protein
LRAARRESDTARKRPINAVRHRSGHRIAPCPPPRYGSTRGRYGAENSGARNGAPARGRDAAPAAIRRPRCHPAVAVRQQSTSRPRPPAWATGGRPNALRALIGIGRRADWHRPEAMSGPGRNTSDCSRITGSAPSATDRRSEARGALFRSRCRSILARHSRQQIRFRSRLGSSSRNPFSALNCSPTQSSGSRPDSGQDAVGRNRLGSETETRAL